MCIRDSESVVCQVSFADEPMRGSIDLLKQSGYPEVTMGHPGYTLAGAVYGVYADSACTKPVSYTHLLLHHRRQHTPNMSTGQHCYCPVKG